MNLNNLRKVPENKVKEVSFNNSTNSNWKRSSRKKTDANISNPDKLVFKGWRDTPNPKAIKIIDLAEDTPNIIISGEISNFDSRETKNGSYLVSFDIYDGSSSINCKAFLKPEEFEESKSKFKSMKGARIVGTYEYNSFSKEFGVIADVIEEADFSKPVRMDDAEEKRVELHMHTQMSQMDAVTSATDLVKRAIMWGHKAVAITDHGVVQAFPEAKHALDDVVKKAVEKATKKVAGEYEEKFLSLAQKYKDIAVRFVGEQEKSSLEPQDKEPTENYIKRLSDTTNKLLETLDDNSKASVKEEVEKINNEVELLNKELEDATSKAKSDAKKKNSIKILYGVEAYLVPDGLTSIFDFTDDKILKDETYCILDIETTGISKLTEKITEFGIMKVKNGEVIDTFECFVNPEKPIPEKVVEVTHITDEMVKDADTIEIVLPKVIDFCKGTTIVAHNASFDVGFIRENARRFGLSFDYPWIDTLLIGIFGKFSPAPISISLFNKTSP